MSVPFCNLIDKHSIRMTPIDTTETIEKCFFVVYKYNETKAMNRVMTLRDQSNRTINFVYVFLRRLCGIGRGHKR